MLDTTLPKEDLEVVSRVLDPYRQQGVDFHAVRTRMAGRRRFVSFHVIVPGSWTVLKGHALCEEIELALHDALPDSTIFTHLEPEAGHWKSRRTLGTKNLRSMFDAMALSPVFSFED